MRGEREKKNLDKVVLQGLNKPIPPAACERALGYLARVRSLGVDLDEKIPEGLLWPILSASFESHGLPLLPNLERLDIDFYTYDRNEYLIPLLSPSLKTLIIRCKRPPKLNAIFSLLNIARVQGCDLEHFAYYGDDLAPHIPKVLTSFNNLRSVSFPLNHPSKVKAPITIIEFLRSLPCLRSLVCHIGTFSHPTDEDVFCHNSLKEIIITVSEPVSLHDLFRTCTFPSVTTVRIRSIRLVTMEGIGSSCPNTRNLSFTINAIKPPLSFNHLVSLLSLPIQSFTLRVSKHTLTASDLRSFAESWPEIRYLRISSDTLFVDPLSSLAAFSNHPHLNHLNIPLPLFQLVNDISKGRDAEVMDISPQSSSISPLRTLFLKYTGAGPRPPRLSTKKKRVVVEHLLKLFPNLEEFMFLTDPGEDSSIGDNLAKFQEILVELREEGEGGIST